MLEELDLDLSRNEVYRSRRLTEVGWQAWPDMLRDALELHEPKWLELQSKQPGYWISHETYRRSGKEHLKAVPFDAAQTLAESQFMRYYLRAVSRRAMDDHRQLEVVRLKQVQQSRSVSAHLLGSPVAPAQLLDSLRQNQGIDPFLHIPPGPNSGLGVIILPN
ncbi:hypothetical protein MUY14_22905 [Amycolatopsis sp. FBCC-B4732]|uniref:hypothetical protein n=1 Tax=Amycolatopsis sp. FBCC-B4732 TaxID=3079339 RepID=UPI001FF1F2C8|nr:hypothetical protein [Amycolatopsis sp. FBCC-B4732]UOX84668.1 hypothetical protein MUY14_22905 [Amycolatopsis sp. FBCC-B4732]